MLKKKKIQKKYLILSVIFIVRFFMVTEIFLKHLEVLIDTLKRFNQLFKHVVKMRISLKEFKKKKKQSFNLLNYLDN